MNPVTLRLPYPISANRYWSSRVIDMPGRKPIVSTFVTKDAKAFKDEVGWLARAAGIRSPIPGRIAIAYTLFPNRPLDWQKRQRKLGDAWQDSVQCIDLDNAQKVLLDALKGIAFEDDVWVREIVARRAEPDAEGARLVVTIKPIELEQLQPALDLVLPRADPLEV